jgi:hypothetical protein
MELMLAEQTAILLKTESDLLDFLFGPERADRDKELSIDVRTNPA